MKPQDLLKLIPATVRITSKVSYEIVWVDEFPNDPSQVGECRLEQKQIVIKKGQSPTETYKCMIHEIIHAYSHEDNINLTETQVLKQEEAIFRILKLNKILDILVKNV